MSTPIQLTPAWYPFPLPRCEDESSEARLVYDDTRVRGGILMAAEGSDTVAIARSMDGLSVLRITAAGATHLEYFLRGSDPYTAAFDLVRNGAPSDYESITNDQPRLVTDYDNLALAVSLSGAFAGSVLALEVTDSAYRLHLVGANDSRVVATLPAHKNAHSQSPLPLGILCAMATPDGARMVVLLQSPAVEPMEQELLYVDLNARMRVKTSALQLSIGCAPNATGSFNLNDAFEFEPMPLELVASALARVLGPPVSGVYRWEENGQFVAIGPLIGSPDYADDGNDCFAEAELLLDVDLNRFVEVLEAVRKTAPALWLRAIGSEDLFLPGAFATEVLAGRLDVS